MIYGQVYLQNYNFEKGGYSELLDDGIYTIVHTGDPYSALPFERFSYSGMYIPAFANTEIFAYPISIGQYIFTSGEGINIGRGNIFWTPKELRNLRDYGEITIGEGNFDISGIANSILGHGNESHKVLGGFIYGTENSIRNSYYNTTIGSANYVSGLYSSSIFGRGNTLFGDPKNDINLNSRISPAKFHTYSGYTSTFTSVIGDNNYLYSGVRNVVSFGHYNNFQNANYITNVGSLNNAIAVSGDNNLMLGHRNELQNAINGNLIGLENSSIKSAQDFTVGAYNVNEIAYRNFTFGENNRIYSGMQNFVVGTANDLTDSFQTIFGHGNIARKDSFSNAVLGKNNIISGAVNNLVLGQSNTLDNNIVAEIYGMSLYKGDVIPFTLLNYSVGYGPNFDPTATFGNNPYSLKSLSGINDDSYDNIFIGNSNRTYFNNYTYILGKSNRLLANNNSTIVGDSNLLIDNNNVYVFGSNNYNSGTANNQVIGSNNSLKLNNTGIFLGFNFVQSGNRTISGVGIKITPTGIDVYGKLRVNGIELTVP